jgi:hypothetical protein
MIGQLDTFQYGDNSLADIRRPDSLWNLDDFVSSAKANFSCFMDKCFNKEPRTPTSGQVQSILVLQMTSMAWKARPSFFKVILRTKHRDPSFK